jgi:predicted TIM-barrel fold metal-dependent hydrolase
MLGDRLADVLDAHDKAAGGLFRGVRYATTWDASPDIFRGGWAGWMDPPEDRMDDETFRRGVRALGERGLVYEAYLLHPQLGRLAGLAGAVDGTAIVVDHLGMPVTVGPYTDRDAVRREWRQGLAEVAARPNTYLKLGGVGMDPWFFSAGWADLDTRVSSDQVVDYWGDDIRWCIDTFGPGRCMFESNYPPDNQVVDYPTLWNAFLKIAEPYSGAERHQLFAGTAASVYKIDLDA